MKDPENDNMEDCISCGGTGCHEVYINKWDIENRECTRCLGMGKVEACYNEN